VKKNYESETARKVNRFTKLMFQPHLRLLVIYEENARLPYPLASWSAPMGHASITTPAATVSITKFQPQYVRKQPMTRWRRSSLTDGQPDVKGNGRLIGALLDRSHRSIGGGSWATTDEDGGRRQCREKLRAAGKTQRASGGVMDLGGGVMVKLRTSTAIACYFVIMFIS
jgi:hypothetical protein